MSLMKTDNEITQEWVPTLLAIVPGVLITIAILINVIYETAFWTTVTLILFVTISRFYRSNKLPGWSLMAVGMLLTVFLTVVSGIFGGITTLIAGADGVSISVATAAVWLVILLILAHFRLRRQVRFSSTIWLITGLVVICNFLVRMKYFYLFDLSRSTIEAVARISLWSAGTLLLPVVIGMYLAQRYGIMTVLSAVGTTFMWFQIIIDNAGRVSEHIHNPLLLGGYLILTPVSATIVGPILYLRAEKITYRLQGLLIATGIAVGANVIISGIVRGDFTLIVWLSAIPYIVSVVLALWLSYLLYRF
jgi:hypothetical protein